MGFSKSKEEVVADAHNHLNGAFWGTHHLYARVCISAVHLCPLLIEIKQRSGKVGRYCGKKSYINEVIKIVMIYLW